MTDDLLREVIQADRDAAAWLYTSGLINAGSADANDKTAAVIAAGEEDGRSTVQAFKNHRLAFASPTPDPSGAVVREVEEACRLVEYDMVHRRMTPGNGFVTQTTDVATIIDYVRASLDAGSASS